MVSWPPIQSYSSVRITFNPLRAAAIAHAIPPTPAPTTTRSALSSRGGGTSVPAPASLFCPYTGSRCAKGAIAERERNARRCIAAPGADERASPDYRLARIVGRTCMYSRGELISLRRPDSCG